MGGRVKGFLERIAPGAGVRWAAALLLLVLPGCSGPGPGDAAALPAADESAIAIVGDAPQGMPSSATTDTLWLTPAARLQATGPTNLTILATLAGAVPQSFAWNATLNGTGTLDEARLVLWLDLQNSALQSGVGGDPACTAAMTLVFLLNGSQVLQPGGCTSAGSGMLPPGEHRLEFSTPLTALPAGAQVAQGDSIAVQVQFGLSLPQGVGHLLAGSGHESWLRLRGLAEPLPVDGNATAAGS